MTRDRDVFMKKRTARPWLIDTNADLFVSIHADASQSRASTASPYIRPVVQAASPMAARAIVNAMKAPAWTTMASVRRIMCPGQDRLPCGPGGIGIYLQHWEATRLRDPYMQKRLAQALPRACPVYGKIRQ